MQRRNFLQTLAAAGLGLGVAAPLALRSKRSKADGSAFGGPFFITLNAGGAYDPTYMCDPKGGVDGDKTTVNQQYTADQIGTSPGGFRYAPIAATLTKTQKDGDGNPVKDDKGNPVKDNVTIWSHQKFFETHESRLVVINGVDTTTNNHDVGTRITWSGLATENTPSFAALVAAAAATNASVPLAYLSSGGYDYTAGLVGVTRTGNMDLMRAIAYPNLADAKNADSGYHTDTSFGRIRQAQSDRAVRLQSQLKLPVHQRALAALIASRNGTNDLQAMFNPDNLAQYVAIDHTSIGDIDGNSLDGVDNLGALDGMVNTCNQAQLALLAFKSGVAAAANLSMGYGYDTHKNHDDSHPFNLVMLTRTLDYIWTTAAKFGVDQQLVVIVGSDFGRTPYYNDDNGKDHWNITSQMVMCEPDLAGRLGITKLGQTVGSTDGGFVALGIDGSATGQRYQPQHIHAELRKIAGIPDAIANQYPITGVDPVPVITG